MARKWFEVRNIANSSEPVEFLIYEQIGESWWDGSGVAAKAFAEAFNAIPIGRKINLRINSPGGSICDGLAIYNTINKRRDVCTAYVDGYALSAASFLMLAASKVVAPENAIVMIHKPSFSTTGTADDLRRDADVLDTHQKSIASIYAAKTGKSLDDINTALNAETWFTGAEAKAFGLVDETTEPIAANNTFKHAVNFADFKNLPAWLRPATASPEGTNTTNNQSGKISDAAPVSGAAGSNTQNKGDTHMSENNTLAPAATTPPAQPETRPVSNRLAKEDLDEIVNRVTTAMKPAAPPPAGVAPLNTPKVENLGSVARNAINAKAQGKSRFEFLRDNWGELSRHIPVVPVQNANTMDTALTTAMLASGLIVTLQNRLAGLQSFTRDFGTDRLKPLAKVQVPIVTAGGTAQSNATSFEDTTNFVGSVDNVEITVARLTAGANLTASELNSGFRMAQFTEIKACELADKIQAAVNAIITTANFDRTTELGVPALVSAFDAFGKTDLDDVWAALEKSNIKNVMLAGGYYKTFLPATLESFNPLAGNVLPGWDGFYLNTCWTGAEAKTKGFACNPQAIAVASGLPLASPNRGLNTLVETIALPGIGLTVELQQWYSTSSKTDWANWEVMFGAAKGDGSAGCLIKTA